MRLRAETQPDRLAYLFLEDGEREAESCTYAELDRRARGIAATLQRMGLEGERALLLYPPGLEFVSAFFGCLYAGVVAVPAYPPRVNRNQARLRSIAVDARPGVALTTAPIRLRAGALGREVPELAEVPWLATEEVPDAAAEEWTDPRLGPDALAFLQYTSGSTSAPKGVMVSHGNILHNERVIEAACRHDGDSTFVSWLPMYHDMGLIGGLLQPLWIGALGVLMAPVAFLQKPSRWLQAISRYRAHTSGAPNFAYELCLRKVTAEESAGLDLTSWQVAFNGAEPVRAETLRRFAERFAPHGFRAETAFPCYGLAEATLFVTGGPKGTPATVVPFQVRALEAHRVEEAPESSLESSDARELPGCGIPWLGHEVRIVRPDTRQACAGDEVGEIWVGGPSVAQGYWARPEVTAESFGARLAETGEGPFLRTGDLGFLHRGELFVTGRIKDLVIVRGRNHYPQDIELTVERSHPALRPGCGAVFSVELEGLAEEERLVVVQEVEREQQRRLDVEAVAAAVRRAVAEEHEIQVHEVVLLRIGAVPKTSSGKIQRRACRASYLAGELEPVGASVLREEAGVLGVDTEAPAVPRLEDLASLAPAERADLLEPALRGELARILRVSPDRIPAEAPLTSLGLDSLNALELRHRLESALGIELPLASLLEGPSLAQLAAGAVGRPAGATESTPESTESGEEAETPLSRGQRALWFVHGLAPESGAYNIAGLARVRGPLDTAALRRSFVRLVDRHAALRSTFQTQAGEPRQRVRPEAESALDFLALEAGAGLEEAVAAALNAPFDLEHGPVLRVRAFALPDGNTLLALAVHHLVADFWSLGVLARELGPVYGEEAGGPAASLPPIPLRYGDFVRWQERMLAGPRGERLWEHWRERLGGELTPADLPADRPRPPVQTYRGAARSLRLDAELTGALHGLGRGRGATLFATLLAGFQALLHRWTGQDDLTVGSPVAGRTSAAWGGVAGYFVNPLVLRADLAGDPAFADHLDRTRQRVLGAFEHQDLPFALLAERLQPVRDPGRSPLFQVAFALQSLPGEGGGDLAGFALGEPGSRLETGPLVLESVAMPRRTSQFDLTMLLGEVGGRLTACCQYNPDLFDDATAGRLLTGFETLLRGAAGNTGDTGLRLSDLPLLSAAERDQALLAWNGEPPAAAWESGIVRLVREHVERSPDAVALAAERHTMTYGELGRRSREIALHLRAAGAGPEMLVGVALERGPEMVAALLGVLEAGGAYLPLDPADPGGRLATILGEARAALVITRERWRPSLEAAGARTLCLDALAGAPSADLPEPGPDHLAYVIYTSGSTGTPKGVEIRHGSLLNLVRWHQQVYGVTAADRATQVAATTFDAAVWEIWPYLCAGASLHFPPGELRSDAAGLANWLERQGITLAFLPTPLAEALLAEERFEAPALRALLTGGDRLRRAPRPDVPFALFNHYGPTESTVVTTWTRVEPEVAGAPALPPSIGLPMAGSRVYVVDRRCNPVPLGVPGELWIGGTGLARGYRGRPETTAASFIPDPFGGEPGGRLYRTGDLARRRPDGSLDFLGRVDHQVKIRGFRIEPGEIEAALRRHPAVRDAVVFSQDLGAGQALVAWAATTESSPEELWRFLAERLPAYMVPAAVVVLESLPLTPHGKVDRRALPEPARPEREGGAPRTPAEELLAGIWRDLLGLETVAREADFFALGGHSLKVAQVVSRLRDATGVELELSAAFEEPTLAGLALRVEEALRRSATPAPALLPLSGPRREGPAPLSFAQERLWFLDRLEPGSPAYAIPVALRLEGELRPDLLEAALAAVVARHESLRTTVAEVEGEPVQAVSPPAGVTLPRVDLRGVPETEALALLRDEARRPFDLARGPLARFLLVRLEDGVHLFLANLHHIVADGWSLNILLEELAEVHEALRAGEAPRLRGLPVQYSDFAVWQREWLRGEELERRVAPWRERLAGLPRLELPADRPRPGIASSRGGAVPVLLPPDLPEALAAFGRRETVTPYMVLLAAFAALLQRHAGQADLAVGSPAAGRNRSEVERLVGLFVNTVVLRLELSPEEPFRAALNRARERTVEAFANQDLPYEKLVEALQPERVAGRGELFQAMLSFQGAPVALPVLEGLRLSPVTVDRGAAQTDLSLDVVATDAGWLASLEYAADLFDEATARRLAERFTILLAGALADPSVPLAGLPLLAEAERAQLLGEWSGVGDPAAPELPIHELIAEQARSTPDAVALVAGVADAAELTYSELIGRAAALAAHLRGLGVGPEVPVGLAVERSPEMIVALLGILRSGGVYLPLDPTLPRERLEMMLDDAGVDVVVTQERVAARIPERGRRVFLESVQDGVDAEPVRVSLDGAAYILYTSGSTGRPKGVVVSHGSLSRFARRATARYGLRPGDRMLQFASLAFDTSVEEIYPTLASGATLVLREGELAGSAAAFLESAGRQGITVLDLPTAYWHELAASLSEERLTAPAGLRLVIIGGEKALAERWAGWRERLPGVRLVNTYGPTEGTVVVISHEDAGSASLPAEIPIGRPWPGTRVYLLDSSLRPVPPGAVGELCIAGDNLARGYLGRPDLTAERFLPDPRGIAGSRLYRTGDLARFLPGGSLEYRGRADHQVKLRGFRVEPGEIEAALARHPGVREAVVVARPARPADTGAFLLAAYVVADADAAELRAFLRAGLPDYMVPAAIVALPSLPRTSSGKIDRRALPEPDVASPADTAAPRTPLEELIAGAWREVLGTSRAGLRESFFDLGGHSLTAARVTARLSRDLGLEVPLRDLFESPTVEGLARRIEERLRGGAAPAPPLQAGGPREQHPLSFAQQRLWFLDRLDPGSPAYHLPAVVRLRGPLRPDALEAALAAVVRRHESLRTRFAEVGGEPVQIVSAEWRRSLLRIDLAGLPEPVRRAEALRLARAEAVRPFDLTAGSLLRARLVTLAPEEHELILVQHHIVTDGWSLDLLAGELAALYDAALDGRTSPLPEPAIQYGDFAAWQHRWLQGEARQRLVDHWRGRLEGIGSLELPSDRPRPAVQTFRGTSLAFELPGVSVGDLETFGRRRGATLFITLLAAFQGLLSRYSRQTGVAVGSPVAGRVRPELEDLVGFFVNTLVLRADLGGEPSFGNLLARVRESTLDAFAHQDLPFEVLVEELQPVREQGRSPLFQVLFTLQPPSRPLALRDVEATVEELDAGVAKFDLALSLAPRGDALAGWMEINADLFDPATALRMVRSFEALLRGAMADPGRAVAELPLLSTAERRQLLEEWNDTRRPYAGPELLHEWIEAQAVRTPSAEAVRFEGESLSYSELSLRADGLARHLRSLGVGPDVLVGVCMERSLELVVSLLAVLKAGGAYVPLDPGYPAERLAFMLEDSATPVLLTQPQLSDRLSSARTVLVEPGAAEWAGEPLRLGVDPDGLAYMIYTSGSTGRPKGAMNTHRAIVNRLLWMQEAYGLGANDRVLQKTPFSFDVSVWELFWPLMTGACLVVARPEGHRDGAYLVDLIRRERVTTLHFVPSMLRAFLEQPGVEECASIRRVVCSGEALPHELQERFFSRCSAELLNLYGPTEAAVEVSFWACRRDDERSLVPIGRPIANVRLHVLDSSGSPCPVGVPGELHISGVALARGYWGRPELTADRFVPDPFSQGGRLYRTGDLARVLPDGSIDYLGRLDHQVKIRGFRIELGEIEAALEDHPTVREAAVVVRADGTGDPRLVACIVPRGESPDVSDLRQALRNRLPDHMVPALFVVLEAMPLTPSGKLDRKALSVSGGERAASAVGAAGAAEYVAPRTAEEKALAEIWAAILGVDRVGVRDDFFQLGGHSLKATQVVSRVRDTFGIEVPLRQLFAEPTVEGLARALGGARSSQAPQRPQREIPAIRAAARGTGNLDELLAKVRQKKSMKGR